MSAHQFPGQLLNPRVFSAYYTPFLKSRRFLTLIASGQKGMGRENGLSNMEMGWTTSSNRCLELCSSLRGKSAMRCNWVYSITEQVEDTLKVSNISQRNSWPVHASLIVCFQELLNWLLKFFKLLNYYRVTHRALRTSELKFTNTMLCSHLGVTIGLSEPTGLQRFNFNI